jgi:hypothetical protein
MAMATVTVTVMPRRGRAVMATVTAMAMAAVAVVTASCSRLRGLRRRQDRRLHHRVLARHLWRWRTAGGRAVRRRHSGHQRRVSGLRAGVCGDGYTQAGIEVCDDDLCPTSCTVAVCGDGFGKPVGLVRRLALAERRLRVHPRAQRCALPVTARLIKAGLLVVGCQVRGGGSHLNGRRSYTARNVAADLCTLVRARTRRAKRGHE